MRLNTLLMNEPAKHLCRSIGGIACQTFRITIEALIGAFNHGLGCSDLGLADGGRGFDIANDRMVEIDQVVRRISEERLPAMSARPAGGGISRRDLVDSVRHRSYVTFAVISELTAFLPRRLKRASGASQSLGAILH
jgi:hypothetical protein